MKNLIDVRSQEPGPHHKLKKIGFEKDGRYCVMDLGKEQDAKLIYHQGGLLAISDKKERNMVVIADDPPLYKIALIAIAMQVKF